jgi:hypothetical protein
VWQKLLASHPGRWHRFKHEPAYTLPEPVVRHLADTTPAIESHHRTRRAIITQDDVAFEQAFSAACEQSGHGTIGVWDGRPIRFDLLFPAPPLPFPSAELMARLGWDKFTSPGTIQREIRQLQQQTDRVRRRLLGYAGYLGFHEKYQAEKQALRARWLPLSGDLPFPLRANVHDRPPVVAPPGAVQEGVRLPDEVGLFLDDMGRFQRKWQLREMVTWDLPLPQGPLGGLPIGVALPLLGPDQLVATSPAFYDPPSSEDEREATRNQQKQAARLAGLGGDFPLAGLGGRGHDASSEADAFGLWLIETTVRTRYGSPRGLTARLVVAFGEILHCSHDRIKQIRKLYLSFLPPLP